MKKKKEVVEKSHAVGFEFVLLETSKIIVDDNWNSRKRFDEQQLFSLCESIKDTGQAQPIAVNRVCNADGDYEYHLISGERRLRASREGNITLIECKVYFDADIKQATDLRFVENFHRADLTHIEQAMDMKRMEEVGFKIADIARRAGVSEDTVRRKIALLELPDEVQKMVDREQNPLPIHQAQLLVGLTDSDALRLAREAAPIVGQVASEAQVRDWVETIKNGPKLPMRTDSDRRPEKSSRITGGQVLSNVRHDPDKDDGANDVLGEPSDNLVIDMKTVQKINRHGVFEKPYVYTLKLPKSLKTKASVRYATNGKLWYWGADLSMPCGGYGAAAQITEDADYDDAKETSLASVLAGLMEIQDHADKHAENAQTKTNKQIAAAVCEAVGKEITTLSRKYLPQEDAAEPTPERETGGVLAQGHVELLLRHAMDCVAIVKDSGAVALEIPSPDWCLFRMPANYTKKKSGFCCGLSRSLVKSDLEHGELQCNDEACFPADCYLAKKITLTK